MACSPGKHKSVLTSSFVTSVGIAGLAFFILKYGKDIYRKIGRVFNFRNPLRHQHIEVINTIEGCESAVLKLRKKCSEYRVVGFDCEWVTEGSRHPIALLQLAAADGFCALIRLSKIQTIPHNLKTLLEDSTILKVGVAPIDDAKYLMADYMAHVNGIIDLRYLAALAGEKPEGLSSLAYSHLNVKMDKNWRIRCSDWEADPLSDKQINYAATDAHAAIEIFKKLMSKILRKNKGLNQQIWKSNDKQWSEIEKICEKFVNLKYHQKNTSQKKSAKVVCDNNIDSLISEEQRARLGQPNFKQPNRKYTCLTRSKPLYQNCYMQTTDGEVLCTCDRKKAEWYVEKNIADMICEEPYTIRLRFEPAGRSVGDVGVYYQMPRHNRCVVCGHDHSYTRKNVVPREYRKLFPLVMKDHSSHDVLLLCIPCHQLSNNRDQYMRNKLATMCNAPIYNKDEPKQIIDSKILKVKSAARALLKASSKHNIPEERQEKLKQDVLDFYNVEELTDELLNAACNLCSWHENDLFEPHGKIVVDYFTNNSGGLLALEQLWREFFLESMKPKFMPDLWSVTHTKSRLEIRAVEGRVDPKDLLIAGLAVENHFASETIQSNSDINKRE